MGPDGEGSALGFSSVDGPQPGRRWPQGSRGRSWFFFRTTGAERGTSPLGARLRSAPVRLKYHRRTVAGAVVFRERSPKTPMPLHARTTLAGAASVSPP